MKKKQNKKKQLETQGQVQEEQYSVVLKIGEEEYKTEGESILDALNKIEVSWDQIKLKGTITVMKGEHSYEKFFDIKTLRKIFINKITRLIWAKRLNLLLNETAMISD